MITQEQLPLVGFGLSALLLAVSYGPALIKKWTPKELPSLPDLNPYDEEQELAEYVLLARKLAAYCEEIGQPSNCDKCYAIAGDIADGRPEL